MGVCASCHSPMKIFMPIEILAIEQIIATHFLKLIEGIIGLDRYWDTRLIIILLSTITSESLILDMVYYYYNSNHKTY